MGKKNRVKRSAASKYIASANEQHCKPATPGRFANNTISAHQSINTTMDNKTDGSHPQTGSQESLSDTFENNLYTEVADSFYRCDVGGVGIADPQDQNGRIRPNRSSKSTGISPDGQIGYDRIHEHGKDLDASHGAHPDRAVSAGFSQPTQGRGDAHQACFHPGVPDLANINTSGRYNSGNPYLDWFGRRSDPHLGGGSMIRDWNGPDQTSNNLKDSVTPYFHPGVDLAPGINESTSREWTLSPTQSHNGRPNNACDVHSEGHDNDGWASDITHHEEGLETWRSAPKEAGDDSGESALEDTTGGGCKKSQQGKVIERVGTRDGSTFGKNIQGDANSGPGGWDWPTHDGDRNQVGGDPFANTTAADNDPPDKQNEPEELKCWEEYMTKMRVDTGGVLSQAQRDAPRVAHRASFSLDPTFKVGNPENSPSNFNWKIENHPWPPIRPNGESSHHKGKESTEPKERVNPFWESDYIEIDDFTPTVAQKEHVRAKNHYINRLEDVPPSQPGLVPNNTTYYPKEDLWANTDNLNRPENVSPRRPFMSLSDTTESSIEDQDAKAELVRISKELGVLKSTTRRTKKKLDKLAKQFKEQKNTAEVTNEATGDVPYWEHEGYFSYRFPMWAIITGAFGCFCLGMMFPSGLRGTSTCIFHGAA